MTYERFGDIAEEEAALLPAYVYEELDGGVLVDPSVLLHPKRAADDLFILGTYSRSIMGTQIVLYYGSFMAVFGGGDEEKVRLQIRATIRHEFLHHLETRAGLYFAGTLVEEDRENMVKYYMRHRRND